MADHPAPAGSLQSRAGSLQSAALAWYAVNGRALAFRRTSDPWAVLVSEVMAQQTQAARAAAAWESFIARYPTPASFAAASPAEAVRAWRGLGYNRRAIALRAAAVRIVTEHDGHVPGELAALEALPGIGPYTARAVLAIAFGRPVAALDTNIGRVLERALGSLPVRARERQAAADALVPDGAAAAWTHALMDVGATICRKRDPRCGACPLGAACDFRRAGSTAAGSAAAGSRQPRPRQPRFEATTRWLRGRILDRLRDSADGRWVAVHGPIGRHDAQAVARALAALAADGLLEPHPADASLVRLEGR